MIDFLFVLIFCIFPILILYYMKVLGIPVNYIGIPSVVISAIFVFAYIGLFPLYFAWDDYRFYGEGIQDSVLVLKAFLFTCLTIFMLLVGMSFSKLIFHLDLTPELDVNYRDLNRKEVYLLFCLLLFSFFVLILYLNAVPKVAIFTLINEGVIAASSARSSMANGFTGKYHWYSLIMHDLLNLITFCFFAAWLRHRYKNYLILFLISLIFSIFTAIMAIHKAPLIWLIIGLFFVYTLYKSKGEVPIFSIIKLATISILFLIISYMYFMGTDTVAVAFKALFSRAFTGGIAPSYYYLEYFPQVHDYLYGTSFPNPGGIFPFTPYALTVEVNNWKFPFLVEQGIVGSAPTIFWAESYANFGIPGVVIIPFVVGVLLAVIANVVNKLENTPIKIGLIVWLVLHYFHLSDSGISGYLFDFYLFGISLFVILLIVLSNNLKLRYKR